MSENDYSEIDDLDDVLDDHAFASSFSVLALVHSKAISDKLAKIPLFDQSISLAIVDEMKEDLLSNSEISCFIIEFNIADFFANLSLLRKIKEKRPLTPIIGLLEEAADQNLEASVYEAGVSDTVPASFYPEILAKKIVVFFKISESSRLIEVHNQELIENMKAQRSANEKLLVVEKEKTMALLEAKANSQTREILDSLHKGFFIIQNRDEEIFIGEHASKTCLAIFNKDISNQKLVDGMSLKNEDEVLLELGIIQIFEDIMPLDVSLDLLPKEVETIDGRIVDFNFTLIKDADDKPLKIVTVASDVTEEKEEKKRIQKTMNLNSALIGILKNMDSFRNFLKAYKDDVAQLGDSSDLQVIKRMLHTLKGNTAAFGIEDLSLRIHEIESEINAIDENDMSVNGLRKISIKSALELKDLMVKFLEEHYNVLKIYYEQQVEKKFLIEESQIKNIREILAEGPEGVAKEVSTILYSLKLKPISGLMALFNSNVNRIAKKLDKSINFSPKGDNLKVDYDVFSPLFHSLIHVVSNSCDHGIESKEDRIAAGKPEMGSICLQFSMHPNGTLEVVCQDDGNGIDVEAVVNRALEKQFIDQDKLQNMSEQEKLALIFADGFSTKDELTEIAGRGVGMAAVKAEVDNLRGEIHIETKRGKYTNISFSFPKISRFFHEESSKVPKILVADDEADFVDIVCAYLKPFKCDITKVHNGLDAMMELAKANYDLLIIDLKMPGLEGDSVVTRVNKLFADHLSIPIIIVSGFLDEKFTKKMASYDNVYLLPKPMDSAAFNQLLKKMIA